MGIQEEEKEVRKSKKDKGPHRKGKKNSDVNGSVDSGSTEHGVAEVQPGSEHAGGDTSNVAVKKDDKKKNKKKKKERESKASGQRQTVNTAVESSGSHAARGTGGGEQPTKSKKNKRKRVVGEPATDGSAGDEIVTRKDKKRKKERSVVSQETGQIGNTQTGKKAEHKKKRKGSDKNSPEFSQNASARGDKVDRDRKKKKKSKEGNGGEQREKEKTARSKDKGKRVSFADDAEVFSIEDSDDKEGDNSDESNLVHGQFTPEEDATIMEAIRDYAEMKQLGEKGLEMIRASGKHPEIKGCWADIATCLPHRPQLSIYHRARTLLYNDESNLVHGQRFSAEEDATLMEAIKDYAEMKQLGEKGLEMIRASGKHPETRGCWADIAKCLPHRPKEAIKRRARILLHSDDKEGDSSDESNLVHGQRFTPEEDATLVEAIRDYAEMKQLGEKGVEMIRASSKHPEIKGCWADIAKCLPHRPLESIYRRARILLYRSDDRKWTPEEYEKILRHVEQHGTEWKTLALELGKSNIHVKDTYRRIKHKNMKKGHWNQDEQQNLFDLVNLDLRLKASQEKDRSHRVIRDNISWEAISDKLTTRSHKNCCMKWYNTLASPLVKEGIWADIDDYLLMDALENVDAVCVEDVDWDNLLDHRSGEVCRRRWNQMVRAIGGHREKPFIEQVEVLSRRYCPEMIEYRQ